MQSISCRASLATSTRLSVATYVRSLRPSCVAPQAPVRSVITRAEGEVTSSPAPAPIDPTPEEIFYEGSGAPAELAVSMLLGLFVITLPLTIASVGRRFWIKYKFTNKRVVVTTDSPTTKRTVQVAYSQIKEVRTAPRAFGAWGDMVIYLKDGSRLEIVGLERFKELQLYIEGFITPMPEL